MKLTRKHIGQLFDVQGSDGSWVYQLVDIKGTDLLFQVFGGSKYETDSNKYHDWRPFETQLPSKRHIKWGWESVRRKK